MKTYKLTSPRMRGNEVKALQRRLAGVNKFKENFHPGKIDGVFGEATAGACYRAKYWLGYPPDKLIRTYGTILNKYLTDKVNLPDAYRERRKARKKAAPKISIGRKALAEATRHLGTVESPRGSNRVKFSVWYGIIGPWCAMFVTYCYSQVGSKSLRRGSRYSYVPYILQDARRNVNGLAVTSHPQPGDLVCFDWNRNGEYDHVGLYEKSLGGRQFQTIEGNTGHGNDSNGGEVMRRQRTIGSAGIVFVRVGR